MKLLKKTMAVLVIICLMITISNIPVYAKATAISAVKTTDAVLSKEYVTPAQSIKKAVTKVTKTTAKKTTAKKTTAKKTTATKKVSLTTQIIKKYTKNGLKALQALANKFGFTLKTVYKTFIKYGVTKEQMKKVSSLLVKLVNRGVIFANCASLAVSKYLGISRNSAALQNLAADIAKYVEGFIKDYSNEKTIVGSGSMNSVLQKNGHKNAQDYRISFKDFMNNLKVGEKVILTTACFNRNGQYVTSHAITIKKEKNGKYGVFDTLLNGGEEVIYTKAEFKKFMNGQSAKGKTLSGRPITKPVYYYSTSGSIRYKPIENGEISVLTDSKNISMAYFKTTDAYKYIQKAISIADKLLNKKGISGLAKTWLKKFKNLTNNCIKSSKSYGDKFSFAYGMYYTIQKIAEEKASILSLAKYSLYSDKNSIYHVAYPLRTVLKNNITYKTYMKYGEEGLDLINKLAKEFNLSKETVYEQFTNNGITKGMINTISYMLSMIPLTSSSWYNTNNWAENLACIPKTFTILKQLSENPNSIAA